MTEDDWNILQKWNSDPEVLYYVDERDISAYSLQETQALYRHISSRGYCFIAELNSTPIGECSIQKMDLLRLAQLFPSKELWRVDLLIGEKKMWGKGIGTEIIGMLTKFGFEELKADMIFGCDIAGYNIGSRKAFERNGYRLFQVIQEKPGSKIPFCWDMVITKEDYFSRK